ncbi:DUF397 domain-containing protein [Actinomadura adrarensis]|uniref:DUF397 domain-containing protein n=1 Tax=Actinomadura adrarensis TaxID=1819600 RepID=A0ABW3CQW8_9ACTN
MADIPSTKWRKSSCSGSGSNSCIEVASEGHSILVRDSKDPDGPRLLISRAEFQLFTKAIKNQ